MQQYGIVLIALFSHDGSTYLAQPCAMSPAGSGEDEACGHFGHTLRCTCFCGQAAFLVYHKGGTVKVGGRERSSYFQLLADDERAFGADYLQFPEASAGSAGYGDEVDDLPVVDAGTFQDES